MRSSVAILTYLILLTFLYVAFPQAIQAQWDDDYIPKPVYSQQSHSLIRSLTIQGAQQIMLLNKDEKHLTAYFANNTQDLLSLVYDEKIIHDDTLKSYLHQIIKNITEKNEIITPRKILVLKSPKANAYSLGDGTLVICNGLLAKLNSEKELAFILAHEMAHWQLRHFKKKIVQNLETTEQYSPERELNSIGKSSYSVESIRNIKRWHYDRRQYSREVELEADSLALILYRNAYPDPISGVLALQNLDSGLISSPYLGAKIFRDLNFKEYPFHKDWAVVSRSVHEDLSNYHSFDPDSSLTHPVLEKRIERLKSYMNSDKRSSIKTIDTTYLTIKTNADFENIRSALDIGNIDQSLYLALRLKQRYPNNAYLVQSIGEILLTAYDMKKDDLQLKYASDTSGYNREQQYVYNFVHNVRGTELAEITYHFMNQKGNFNREKEEHYLILYETCSLTDRVKVRSLVKRRYAERFEDGKYLIDMTD